MAKTRQPTATDSLPASQPVRQSKFGLLYVCIAVFFFSTSPIFVLREPLSRRKYLGIAVAIIGIAIMVGFTPNYTACSLSGTGQCMALGDGMALLSGLCFAIYSIAGRGERDHHPLFRYTTNVYG